MKKTTTKKQKVTETPEIRRVVAFDRARRRPPAAEDIARRAYELFLARGGAHGRDEEDWLLAESELTETVS